MTRKCSHCGHNGHNSRTCPDRGVRLFGVRLTDGVSSMNMRKSVSMNNLSHYASAHNSPLSPPEHSESGAAPDGYVSDGMVQTSNNARERKKGMCGWLAVLLLLVLLLFHFLQALVLKLVPITTGLNEFARQVYFTNLWRHHHHLESASRILDEYVN